MAALQPGQSSRIRQLHALARLVRAISRARDAQEIYEPALEALSEIVGVDRSSILLLEGGVARFVASKGLSEPYRAKAEGHFPWNVDDPAPEPILVDDVDHDLSLTPLRSVLSEERIRALAFIPLVYRERLVGKFMLYFDRPHVFDAEEVELATVIADLVAFAVERARLYAERTEADRRKDMFLAMLGHELRNPLAPASAALALMESSPDDLEVAHKAQRILSRCIEHITKLIDDLTDVSRITRGVISIDKAPVDLVELVHHAIAPVEALLSTKHQQLELRLPPLWVEADALRLEQVITNLVHNAAKYTPEGGHITVEAAPQDGGIELHVRDDGAGISPELLDKVFDVFVQADQSLARSHGGLGIGLALVKKVAELHGGTVRISSEGEGRGTDVAVWLPGRVDAPPATTEVVETTPARAHRRVLVVDDNEDAASTLAMLLELWGHEVTTVGDGPSALEAVAAQHPEAVLLDLGLPGMTGYEVAQRLRASGEKELQIVAISGYGQPEDVARAKAAGFDAHLTKPVDPGALQRLLADGVHLASR
jgi:signal transduction histidine kinase/ActR/RegA family two-component response regulator